MLEISGLTKHYATRAGLVRAVDDVSIHIAAGSTMAVVGESGCGKTTIAKMLLQLERPTAGSIRFEGRALTTLDRAGQHAYRRAVAAVFQDPYASLNPRLRVGTIIAEPVLAHENPGRAALDRIVAEVLDVVGLPASSTRLSSETFTSRPCNRLCSPWSPTLTL